MTDYAKLFTANDTLLDKKAKIFIMGIEDRVSYSLDFIKKRYSNYEHLKLSVEFIEYHYSDGVKSDFENLQRVGFFPSTETEMELDHSIKHALIGSYKSAFADLRRAIELVLTSIFLTSNHVDKEKAIAWVNSKSDTPFLSQMLTKLVKSGRFEKISKIHKWDNRLREFYWALSDFSHNKGSLNGYRELNQTNIFMSGTSAPSINLKTLEIFCDYYITTIGEIVTMLALYNPLVLIGLPIDQKFGINEPLSGFYYDHQAELIHKLIPNEYQQFFDDLSTEDEEIQSVKDWIFSMKDITEAELNQQLRAHEEFMKKLSKRKK